MNFAVVLQASFSFIDFFDCYDLSMWFNRSIRSADIVDVVNL